MDMGNSQYVIIILSLTIFLIPISQVDAIFFIPLENSDEGYYKNFKEIYNLKIQKFRDYYIEEYLRLHNPYNDKMSDDVIIFNDKEFRLPNSIDRYDENFQTLKVEQLDLAQKKYLEILGGRIITSSLDDKPDKRIIPILEFTSEEESIMEAIQRNDEGFQTYKMQQVIIAENTFNRLMEEGFWGDLYVTDTLSDDFNQNRDELKTALELIEDESISLKRSSQEFHDLIIEQTLLAEKTRNQILSFSKYPNLNEENDDVIEYNQKEITEKPESIFSDTNHELLEFSKNKQIEIAQELMNKMYNLENSEKNIQVETIIIKEENKKPKVLVREDQGFEFLKNIEKDKAEKKIIELLGGKTISNFADVKTKVGSITKLRTNQNDVNLSDYDKFQNYTLELIAIGDKIREKNNEENFWYLSLYISSEKNEIENKPIRDPNILCFGLGC